MTQGFVPLIACAALLASLTLCRASVPNGSIVGQASRQKALDLKLMQAVSKGKLEQARALLDKGASANAHYHDRPGGPWHFDNNDQPGDPPSVYPQIWDDRTALMLAAERADSAITQLLLERGANPNAEARFSLDTDKPGGMFDETPLTEVEGPWRTPLYLNSTADRLQVMRLLLAHGADPNKRALHGGTPLSSVSEAALTAALLDAGAKADVRDDQQRTPLMIACGGDSDADEDALNRVRLLLAHGAEINARDADGRTTLIYAVAFPHKGQLALVALLLDKGADVNAADKTGTTALRNLFTGLDFPHPEFASLVKLLLDHGAKIDAPDRQGLTPFSEAVKSNSAVVVGLFLDHGASVNAAFHNLLEDGLTPLMVAAMSERFDIVRLLLDRGASVDTRTGDGRTALIFAASAGNGAIVYLLLAHGADANARDHGNATALMAAAHSTANWGFKAKRISNLLAVRSLLEKGADPQASDAQGRTALDLAVEYHRPEILKLIKETKLD